MPLTREQRAAAFTGMLPLNTLRFAAAVYVMLTHVWQWFPWWTPPNPAPPEWVLRLTLLGFSAVGMFFILSGFTLAIVYLSVLDGPLEKRRFMVARFARFYPVFVVSLLLFAPQAWIDVQHRWPEHTLRHAIESLAATLALVHGWSPKNFVYWNPPTWFLCADAFFFVLFLWLGPRLWRLRRGYASALSILFMLMPLVIAWLMATLDNGQHRFYMKPPAQVHQFLLGILIARIYCSGVINGWSSAFWRLRIPLVCMLAFGAGTAAGLCLLPYQQVRPWMQFGGLLPFNAALILFMAHGGGWLARLLSGRVSVELGQISYSVYVLHLPIAYILRLNDAHSVPLTVVYLFVCVGVGWVVYNWFEAPLRRQILDWEENARPESAATAALT